LVAKIVLQRNRKKRLEQGHPWVYRSEVDTIEDGIVAGDIVDIYNHQGLFLARGYANPASQMTVRVMSYVQEEIDEVFLTARLQNAWAFRTRLLADTGACRAVYGEADFLPGLIVDKYNGVLVLQILSAGMEALKPMLLPALQRVFRPTGILLRNDVPVRALEGLTQGVEVWAGDVPRHVVIEENGLQFEVDLFEGQKTGYFFDQRDNRVAIAPYVRQSVELGQGGAEVLECFCHTASFTAHALHYGAKHVTAVDISEAAVVAAKRNLKLNGMLDRATLQVGNAFDVLREAEREGRQYDVVMLDPPAFAKSKRQLEGAYRGYKEINLRGMKLVKDGGFLVTASCSYHMVPELFREMIAEAALDAHKVLRLTHWSGAAVDHPEIVGVDEGHYLKFAIFEVRSRRS